MSRLLPALQPTFAAPDERLNCVAAKLELPALIDTMDLYAAIEALQVIH